VISDGKRRAGMHDDPPIAMKVLLFDEIIPAIFVDGSFNGERLVVR
jgi:hypothetical protein